MVGANAHELKIRCELFRIGFSSLTEGIRPVLDPCNDIFSDSTKDLRVDRLSRRVDRPGGGLNICLRHMNTYLSI